MTGFLKILKAGPNITVQDWGWQGTLSFGLSRGGAADTRALLEAAVLLGHASDCAAIELAGLGGDFVTSVDTIIALTGAPMPATLEGRALVWNASHVMRAGERLSIGAARQGVYGYLSVAGGVVTEARFGSRSTHLTAGIGARLNGGDTVPIGIGPSELFSQALTPDARFEGGVIRILPSAQTDFFPEETRNRFEATTFIRSPLGNRQGVRLAFEGDPFTMSDQLTLLSEMVVPGDIQMAGDGSPYVLMPDCQTTGGYPRIGTVLPDDLLRVAQAAPGTELRFQFLSHAEALALHQTKEMQLAKLAADVAPLVRDPHDIANLLDYNLISGVVSGNEDEGSAHE
jgi:biotin-dependent carboxylase-like uncharacterized protein